MNEEEIESLQKRYRLTPEEYQEYYKVVNLYFTTGRRPVEKPKLVFVAGQAGAGKTKLIPIVNKQLGYNAAIVDYDIVRSLHPRFEQASRECPSNIHLALLPDANRANDDLRHYCKDNNINLIYEGTMRGTKGFIKTAQEFKNAGYQIDLSLMSVPKLESYGSTLLRYATDLLENNIPRWVPKEVHDESYENFIITLRELQKQSLFDRAEVYHRGRIELGGKPIKIYSTEGREFIDPIDAVEYGRYRYKVEAVLDFQTKFDTVKKIFEEKSPHMLEKLQDWKDLYIQEKEHILDEREDIKRR